MTTTCKYCQTPYSTRTFNGGEHHIPEYCRDALKIQRDAARGERDEAVKRGGVLDLLLYENHAMLALISGALCDAKDVPVEPYDEAVRELVRQRDEARRKLANAEADMQEMSRECAAHVEQMGGLDELARKMSTLSDKIGESQAAKLAEAVALLRKVRAGSFGYLDRIDAFLAGQAEGTKPQT
jgi:hypothetical protein